MMMLTMMIMSWLAHIPKVYMWLVCLASSTESVCFVLLMARASRVLCFLAVAPEAAILASQKPAVTFSEGPSGALMCMATGVPAPVISWFSNRVLLSDDSVSLVITSSTDDTMSLLSVTSTLNVTSVMRDSAFATITCTASNGVGANSSDSTQLIVLCELFVPNVVCKCLLYAC